MCGRKETFRLALPLLIELLQLRRKCLRLGMVTRRQEIIGKLGMRHASGRVEPRREGKSNAAASDGCRIYTRHLHEGTQSGMCGAAQRRNAGGDNRPILPPQGHDVCDSSKGGKGAEFSMPTGSRDAAVGFGGR